MHSHGEDKIAADLRTAARGYLDRHHRLEDVVLGVDVEPHGGADATWLQIAELGWLGLSLPESAGGFEVGPRVARALFEETGRALLPGPFFASTALAGPCLHASPGEAGRLAAGESRPTLAWGEPGGSVSLSSLENTAAQADQVGTGWSLRGTKSHVLEAASATEVVVAARAGSEVGLFVVDLHDPGVRITLDTSIDPTRREYTVDLDGAAAMQLEAGDIDDVATRIRRSALLAVASEAVAIGERVLDDVVQHAVTRRQFGKPIGSFQAVSGQLVDCYVDLQLASALVDWAVLALEEDDDDVDVALAAAKSSAAEAAVRTCERALQVCGAIGFTWEFHLHRFLRRSLWIREFDRDTAGHRSEIACTLLDHADHVHTVELLDDEESARLRAETRTWIEASLPTSDRGLELIRSRSRFDETRARWRWLMGETGHLVAHWPAAFGGRQSRDLATAIFREEAIRAHPRVSSGDCGYDLVAPLLMAYGTPDQQQRFLDPIRHETETWTQGFSEPDAGSDLVALRTAAVRHGDGWVINGSKIWATYGPEADWIFVLARTDLEAKPHRGISCFLVDASTPGVQVRPIKDITGGLEFAEIFFTDVWVPASALLGKENEGWQVAITTLAHERVIESYEDMGELGFVLDRLVDTVRAHESSGTSPEVLAGWRQRLADLWCRLQAVRFVQYDAVLALESGGTPPAESEIVKLVWSKVAQEASALGLEMCSALHGPPAPLVGTEEFWQWNYLNARSLTIYAGTSEIITCVIAERVLGLPRSR